MHILGMQAMIPYRKKKDARGQADNVVGNDVGVFPSNIANVREDRIASLTVVDEDRVAATYCAADERAGTGLGYAPRC